jgi:hypothetical protein
MLQGMAEGSEPCDALQAEMALDLLEGELAAELPAHMRAFARAHADDRPPPSAPLLARLASTLETARAACRHDVLADRGLALIRLVAPLVIEDDAAVVAARAEPPSWSGLAKLSAARDAAARARFGCGAIELLHRLGGVPAEPRLEHEAPGPAIEGWQERDGRVLDAAAIHDAWLAIAARAGVTGTVRVDRTKRAHPRAFVVEPKSEVIVVVPQEVATPAARFAVLHELGHAVVALALPAGVPRVVDEAAASYIARLAEPPSWLPPKCADERAPAARRRRLALAAMLDDIERNLPALADVPSSAPPWALWNDPGAQAAYVEAEVIADRLANDLGANPPRGQLLRALKAERDRIDHRTRI